MTIELKSLNLRSTIEVSIHVLLILFILTSVNINWTENWFDTSLRTNTPAPLSVLFFFVYFYVNAFVLIPRFFSKTGWKHYLVFSLVVFVLPELVRITFYGLFKDSFSFEAELFGRDSLLFGAPSAFFLAINSSFVYRLTKDWFVNRRQITDLQNSIGEVKSAKPYEDIDLLSKEESIELNTKLTQLLVDDRIFLNKDLTLRDLSESLGSTEKKVSYFVNQELDTSFYELINKYRVDEFKRSVESVEYQNLSILGIAENCGFPSKSSFYRAFKQQVGMSPSTYIKSLDK